MDAEFKSNAIKVLAALLCLWAGAEFGRYATQQDAVKRGLGQYCLKDGAFAWVGECGK
jgi:hypothetical protein